jgi:hypothetical protein
MMDRVKKQKKEENAEKAKQEEKKRRSVVKENTAVEFVTGCLKNMKLRLINNRHSSLHIHMSAENTGYVCIRQ